MPGARELLSPLGAAFALAAAILFFGGGPNDGSMLWIGGAAALVFVGLVAIYGFPRGSLALVPLIALAAWCMTSIAWSIEPDRSWEYANRTLVYVAFALVGTYAAGRIGGLATGFSALLGAVAVWALGGKMLPALHEDYGRIARLSAPVGHWNALALLGDIALPIGLWLAGRSRIRGTLLVYGWMIVIALTLSRNGVAVAVLMVVAWIAASRLWVEATTTLLAAGLPAAAVLAVAFRLDGITKDAQSHATRVHDGLLFGAALVLGALAAAGFARLPRAEPTAALRRTALVLASVLAVAVLGFGAAQAPTWWDTFTSPTQTEVSNGAGRLGSADSNHRWAWWQQAWHGWQANKVTGTGAGTFRFTNLRYRTTDTDNATEPHNLPVQFLTETGLVGLAAFLIAGIALIEGSRRRSDAELALSLALPAYLLHGLFDFDWDFAAVTAPVLLITGALVAAPIKARRPSPGSALVALGLAIVAISSLGAPWLSARWTNEAEASASPAQALDLAKRARSSNPLALEPLYAQAFVWENVDARAGTKKRIDADTTAYFLLAKATELQPQNPFAWLLLGEFALGVNCPQKALPAFERSIVLNPQSSSAVYAEKEKALKRVNAGKALC